MDYETAQKLFKYDPETGILRWRSFQGVAPNSKAGRPDREGYLVVRIRDKAKIRREHRVHRIAWLLSYGEPIPDRLDHKNGDRVDNRILNIRPATASENSANSKLSEHNTSGFRGVSRTRHGTWRAAICCRRKHYHLGTFKTPEGAARAYDVKAKEVFGPYAKLNFE